MHEGLCYSTIKCTRKARFFLFPVVCCFLIGICSCTSRIPDSLFSPGHVDYKTLRITEETLFDLSGPWNFRYEDEAEQTVLIPHNWRSIQRPPSGVAEYSLHIDLPREHPPLALRIGEIGTAAEIFINNIPAARAGKIGSSRKDTTPAVYPLYVPIPEDLYNQESGSLSIRIRVANFEDTNGGGLWGRVALGSARTIERSRLILVSLDAFMSGIFIIIALYYLALFMYRPGDTSSLIFSLICAAFFMRQISTGEKVLFMLFPSIKWLTVVRIEYLSLYCLVPLFAYFFHVLFPVSQLSVARARVLLIGPISALAVVFLPVPWFIATLMPVQLYWILLLVFTFHVLLVAVHEKRSESVLFLGSFFILALAALNDILLTRFYVPTRSLVTSAQAIFIFFQSLTLSRRFAREYRRTKNLEEENVHLSQLAEAKTRFFTASSHELRTPVSLILTPLEAIMSGRYGESLAPNAPVFLLIKRNCERLKHLADSLLDYVRFESGSVEVRCQQFDLSSFLGGYRDLFQAEASRRGITFSLEASSPVFCYSDPVLLETVILNLLSNAFKYTPRGGSVTIGVNSLQDTVSFKVSDSGCGIVESRIPFLFDRFTAASCGSGTSYTGFGIGLPLCAEITLSLGGRISVESSERGGSVFTVHLPSGSRAENSSTETLKAVSPGERARLQARVTGREDLSSVPSDSKLVQDTSKPSVLVVDDDLDMREFLFDILSPDFLVYVTETGDEALSLASQGFRPAVILCDIMMPVLDGFALREKILEIQDFDSIPFLFLSARSDSQTLSTGLGAGAVDFIRKPFNTDELLAKIHSLIRLSSAERDRLERRMLRALRAGPETWTSPAASVDWKDRATDLGLTERDFDVVSFLVYGLSDKEIASKLQCSPRTVSNRVSAILKKTGTTSRSGLIALLSGTK